MESSVVSTDGMWQTARYFDRLVNLVPPKFYLVNEDDTSNNPWLGMQNSRKKKTNMKHRQREQQARNAAKRAKLDPHNALLVTDLQARQRRQPSLDQSTEDVGSQSTNANLTALGPRAPIRNPGPSSSDAAGFSILLKPHRRPRSDGSSSVASEMGRGGGGRGEVEAKPALEATGGGQPQDMADRGPALKKKRKHREDAGEESDLEQRNATAGDKLDFGAFEDDDEKSSNPGVKKGRRESKYSLLQKAVERRQKQIQMLKSASTGNSESRMAALDTNAQQKWDGMFGKALGRQNKKDDPHLLRKAIRQEKQKKRKSAIKWAARVEGQREAKEMKDAVRREHLGERRAKVLEKKIIARGGVLPKKEKEKETRATRRQVRHTPGFGAFGAKPSSSGKAGAGTGKRATGAGHSDRHKAGGRHTDGRRSGAEAQSQSGKGQRMRAGFEGRSRKFHT